MGDKGELPVGGPGTTRELPVQDNIRPIIIPPQDSIDTAKLVEILENQHTFASLDILIEAVTQELKRPEIQQALRAANYQDKELEHLPEFLNGYPQDPRAAFLLVYGAFVVEHMRATDPESPAVKIAQDITGEHAAVIQHRDKWEAWYFFPERPLAETDELPAVTPKQREPGAPLFTLPMKEPEQK